MSATRSEPQTVKFRVPRTSRWSPTSGTAAHRQPPDRPTVLMLHGGGQNRFSWKNTGQILADQGLHVVALDSRGHGDSDRAPERELHSGRAVRRHAGRDRPDRAAGGSDRREHGRNDRDAGRRRRRPGEGDEAGARRRGAAVREGRQRPHSRFHGERHRRIRVARRGGRCRRRVPAVPDEATQPGGVEEEPAASGRPVVLALGSGVSDRAQGRSVRQDGEARAGRDRT